MPQVKPGFPKFKGSKEPVKTAERPAKAAKAPKKAPATKKAAPRKKAPAKKAAKAAPTKSAAKKLLQFFVDGIKLNSPPGKGQNKLAGIAYFHTGGIKEGELRISTKALKELLASLGVADPSVGPWRATLPNGKIIEAKPV